MNVRMIPIPGRCMFRMFLIGNTIARFKTLIEGPGPLAPSIAPGEDELRLGVWSESNCRGQVAVAPGLTQI